ncbi:MAG: NAD(P)/FAD-dependent oxidoreductase [Clostridia bacterium]|nr:NAD(P)/FAD-dependent oxidoreductase [Clostridia bacterium]
MFDFVVIGAGVIGGMVARELALSGGSVCIVEAMGDVAMGATRANSAIVHAGFDAKEGSLKARFNVRGSEMMEGVCRDLGVKYKRNGSLVVGFTDEDRETLAELLRRGEKNGVKGLRIVEREELLSIEKNIGEGVKYALVAPSGAIVCPYELCIASVGNAMDNGAELKCNFKVTKIEKIEHGYRVFAGESYVEGAVVVNAAGVFSDEIAALVGISDFTVHPRRGEYMLLDKECGSLIGHTVFRCPSKMGKGILVSPTVDGNLLLGPTAEDIEDKSDTATSAAGIASVRAAALEQVAGVNLGKVITTFTGLRAVGSTGDFIINMKDGFINCAGIESPGLTSAPAIAEYIASLLGLTRDKTKNPTRRAAHYFRELSTEEKNALIAKRPEFAHVICRCETVTEGEILDAIRANPRPSDLDGVKRRTRASMGRCQGGFCSPYIVELLARELGVPFTAVTKCGGGSYINIGRTKEN